MRGKRIASPPSTPGGPRWPTRRCSTTPTARSPRSRSTGPSGSTRSCRRCPTSSQAPVDRASLDGAVKVIVLRGAGRAFCAGFDFGGGFHHWDEAHDDRRRAGTPARTSRWRPRRPRAGAQVHEPVALAEARDRPGPRLVRRRRQRHGAVRRPRDRQRGRPHRHLLLAHVGLLPDRHVALPARPHEGQGIRADGPAAVGRRSGRGRADQPRGAVRRARGRGRRRGRAARRDPALAADRDEADRQPGLREHGPGLDADARADPRRADAQHARGGRRSSSSPSARASAPRSAAATGRSATTARRRRASSPTRTT